MATRCKYVDVCPISESKCQTRKHGRDCVGRLMEDIIVLDKRLRHLLKSDFISSFDKLDRKTHQYERDIAEADKLLQELHKYQNTYDRLPCLEETYNLSEQKDRILYLCDRKKCEKCSNSECSHTTDIRHAVNFSRHFDGYCFIEMGQF